MSEPISGAAGAAVGVKFGLKVLATPGVIGVVGGALGFLFLWPKDRKEGFSRLLVSGLSSHFFGDAVLRTIVKFADWIPADEIQAGAYLIAALPAWWILGGVMKYLAQGKDIKQMAEDVKEVV